MAKNKRIKKQEKKGAGTVKVTVKEKPAIERVKEACANIPAPTVMPVSLNNIIAVPADNPRWRGMTWSDDGEFAEFVKKDTAALRASMRKVNFSGVGVVASGDDKYRLIFGFRRYYAASIARISTVNAFVFEQGIDPEIAELVAVMENESSIRTNPDPMAEARVYREAIDRLKCESSDYAKLIQQSTRHVNSRLALLELPACVQTAVMDGQLSSAVALTFVTQDEDGNEVPMKDDIAAKVIDALPHKGRNGLTASSTDVAHAINKVMADEEGEEEPEPEVPDYSTAWKKGDLMELAEANGIEIPKGASKPEIVRLLDAVFRPDGDAGPGDGERLTPRGVKSREAINEEEACANMIAQVIHSTLTDESVEDKDARVSDALEITDSEMYGTMMGFILARAFFVGETYSVTDTRFYNDNGAFRQSAWDAQVSAATHHQIMDELTSIHAETIEEGFGQYDWAVDLKVELSANTRMTLPAKCLLVLEQIEKDIAEYQASKE